MGNSLRQFDDLQLLAKRVLEGNNFEVDLEIFSKFSEDMRFWLLNNFDDPMIIDRADQIPSIQYQRRKRKIWDFLPGGGGIAMFGSYREKEEVREQVREAARLYASIHFLLRNYDEGIV
jgi:hypothetical protein